MITLTVGEWGLIEIDGGQIKVEPARVLQVFADAVLRKLPGGPWYPSDDEWDKALARELLRVVPLSEYGSGVNPSDPPEDGPDYVAAPGPF